ncbi:MAG: YopX family protein [Flavobacteriales bacterium]|nr:YopX family protein [Flavobacteriales bacterium]
MRTIKFRAKTIKTGQWLYGDLIHNRGKVYVAPVEKFYFDGITEANFEVDEKTIGQFTETEDLHGKEIYEGDILEIECLSVKHLGEKTKAVVVFDQGTYFLDDKDKRGSFAYHFGNDNIVMIGNIYDNPELLK